MGRLRAFLAIVTLAFCAPHAQQVCNLAVSVCPKTLEGSTITVPNDVVWLDPKLPFCPEQVPVKGGTSSIPASIVFIIDNSGSMSIDCSDPNNCNSSDWNDPDEARFIVTRALLDSIYRSSPNTEVGMVVFTRRLQFDYRDNAYYKPAFPTDPTQGDAYIPLTKLNASNVAGTGMTGVEFLKSRLEYTGNGLLVHGTKRPASRYNGPNGNHRGYDSTDLRNGTDITLGFEAAKLAIQPAVSPKENQYFIFLSDGEPVNVDNIRRPLMMDFQQGANTPTTFTIFFNRNGPTVPTTIRTMTENIKANGFSTSNPSSYAWAISSGTQLLVLVKEKVLDPILTTTNATPNSASLVSGATTLQNPTRSGEVFVFPGRVPLSPDQTQVKLTYTYTYQDSGKEKPWTKEYTLNIRRQAGGVPPAGVKSQCYDPGDIQLHHEGKQISIVTADHANLDVRLVLPSGEVCNNCQVTVKPRPRDNRGGIDSVKVPVATAGGVYTGTFGRETSATANPADAKLQNVPGDSIIVTWVNPANPLHTIRKAFPYSDVSTVLRVATHNDVARPDGKTDRPAGQHWVLAGSPNVKVTTTPGSNCCEVKGTLTPADSASLIGLDITASRSFKVEILVYDNLGQFVNKVAFSVSQDEFLNLTREPTGSNRRLRVLWDSRTADGGFAGTGAYVFKTTVTLNKIPGVAEDQVVKTDHRLVGVVRGQK